MPREQDGWGLDAQWNDDFHHSLRVAFTGEQAAITQILRASPDLAHAFRRGICLSRAVFEISQAALRQFSRGLPGENALWCSAQNHDQVGNRKPETGSRQSLLSSS